LERGGEAAFAQWRTAQSDIQPFHRCRPAAARMLFKMSVSLLCVGRAAFKADQFQKRFECVRGAYIHRKFDAEALLKKKE